jgi:hypothetical protein
MRFLPFSSRPQQLILPAELYHSMVTEYRYHPTAAIPSSASLKKLSAIWTTQRWRYMHFSCASALNQCSVWSLTIFNIVHVVLELLG